MRIFCHSLHFSEEEVWAVLGKPDRVDWVPGVKSCDFDGEVRSLILPGAGAIKERILLLTPSYMVDLLNPKLDWFSSKLRRPQTKLTVLYISLLKCIQRFFIASNNREL